MKTIEYLEQLLTVYLERLSILNDNSNNLYEISISSRQEILNKIKELKTECIKLEQHINKLKRN